MMSESTVIPLEDENRSFFVTPVYAVYISIIYILVFLIGFIGNLCVVTIVCKQRRMRSVTNIFIANLACADLLVIVFCVPIQVYNLIVHGMDPVWDLGHFICRAVPYSQGVSVSASINTLVAISVERWLAICHPIKRTIKSKDCKLIITVIWIYSFLITMPWMFYFDVVSFEEKSGEQKICMETWPIENIGNIYFVVSNLLMCYIVPLCAITACYWFIWLRVNQRKVPSEANNGYYSVVQRSKMKVIKMMVIVVCVFSLSWLPLYVTFFLIKFNITMYHFGPFIPIFQCLGVSNSCINPILYAYLDPKFRQAFKIMLQEASCCKGLSLFNIGDTTHLRENNIERPVNRRTIAVSYNIDECPPRRRLLLQHFKRTVSLEANLTTSPRRAIQVV